MTDSLPLDELTFDQCGIAARACDVHRQMLSKQSRTMGEGWKKEELKQQMEDLRIASDLLKRQEQELLDEHPR